MIEGSDSISYIHCWGKYEFLVISEVVVDDAIGHQGDEVAADPLQICNPELTIKSLFRAKTLCPEGIIISAAGANLHSTV